MPRYVYTQESGPNFKVSISNKADAYVDTNEVRQILDDLGELLGHSKFDDSYPKDGTAGGDIDIRRVTTKSAVATLTIAEAGFVKVSAAAGYTLTLPTAVGNKLTYIFVKTDDNSNLITIDGHNAETINGSLTYTGLNSQYASVAIRSDNTNWYILFRSRPIGIADNNLLKVDDADAADNDYAKFTANGLEGRSAAESKTDLGFITDLVDDNSPELGGELDAGAHSVGFTLQTYTGDGTTTIDWRLGLKTRFTFGAQADTLTFIAPTNPCNLMLMVKQDGIGGRDLTLPGTVTWLGNEPTWADGGANKSLAVAIFYDGTTYWCIGSEWEV